MWLFNRKGPSGFSASTTAEEVTEGIDGTGLTAIVTGHLFILTEKGNNNNKSKKKKKNWVLFKVFIFQCVVEVLVDFLFLFLFIYFIFQCIVKVISVRVSVIKVIHSSWY